MVNEHHCVERKKGGNDESIIGSECCIGPPSCEHAQSNRNGINDTKCDTGLKDTISDRITDHGSGIFWYGALESQQDENKEL